MIRRPLLALAAFTIAALAHPMGNFSVSHYSRIEVQQTGMVRVTYVLDLAELPTFELLQKWELKQDSPALQIEAKAAVEARTWAANLKFVAGGKRVAARVLDTKIVMADGAGNLPIARITSHLEVPANSAGALEYDDTNYPERAGWKEIVVGAAKGVTLIEASHIDVERSKALTVYPTDPTIAPPQDLHAQLEWKLNAGPVSAAVVQPEPSKPIATAAPAPQEVGGRPMPAAPGEVVKGDALSQLLSKRDLSFGAILLALFMAFWFGCAHAATPGHGKTMVAAYLVGERGTPKHAIFLGAMVTFTHTITVFALGIATYFLAGSFAPETVTKVLGILSGLTIVVIGLWLLYKRSMKLVAAQPARAHHDHHHDHKHHDHDHDHQHAHAHAHAHSHAVAHSHAHAPVLQLMVPHKHGDHGHDHQHGHDHSHDHGHHHGPGGHSHVPEGPVTFGSLIALGASGGMVPCPSALVLLLSAISIGRIGFGLALLVSFSLGLAGVLMAIGLAVLYAKHLLPKTENTMKHPLVKLIPVLSAGVITVIGIAMTTIALGWVKVAGV
jgi:nickel/cobalt exporter